MYPLSLYVFHKDFRRVNLLDIAIDAGSTRQNRGHGKGGDVPRPSTEVEGNWGKDEEGKNHPRRKGIGTGGGGGGLDERCKAGGGQDGGGARGGGGGGLSGRQRRWSW